MEGIGWRGGNKCSGNETMITYIWRRRLGCVQYIPYPPRGTASGRAIRYCNKLGNWTPNPIDLCARAVADDSALPFPIFHIMIAFVIADSLNCFLSQHEAVAGVASVVL